MAYVEKVLKRCNMHNCSSTPALFVKGDKHGSFQSRRNQLEIDQMKSIPYASAIRSIMYAQVCTCPALTFVTGLLGGFQSNRGMKHWKAAKKVLCYLERTKHYMLMYKKIDKVIGYSYADFCGMCELLEVNIRLFLHTRK
jgi:hypothetical protein